MGRISNKEKLRLQLEMDNENLKSYIKIERDDYIKYSREFGYCLGKINDLYKELNEFYRKMTIHTANIREAEKLEIKDKEDYWNFHRMLNSNEFKVANYNPEEIKSSIINDEIILGYLQDRIPIEAYIFISKYLKNKNDVY